MYNIIKLNNKIQFVVIGNPQNRRVTFIQHALKEQKQNPAIVIPYVLLVQWELKQLKNDKKEKSTFPWHKFINIKRKTVIRLDSPGEHFEVEKAFIALGASEREQEAHGSQICIHNILQFLPDKGRILYPRQAYLGYASMLLKWGQEIHSLFSQAHKIDNLSWMNDPKEVIIMFDKCLTHRRLEEVGIPQPRAWMEDVGDYSSIRELMVVNNLQKIFIKIANGSSASGVVAYFCDNPSDPSSREFAYTSVELQQRHTIDGSTVPVLYNSLNVRKYFNHNDIVTIVNTLAKEKVIIEEWLPKMVQKGLRSDLRIVYIDGKAQHFVVRSSRSPMTNLHLGNKRGDSDIFLKTIHSQEWDNILYTCERIATDAFPHTLYAGVDVLVNSHYSAHYILEVNAFGDLLPRIVCKEGLDTYSAEVKAIIKQFNSDKVT